MRRAATRNGGFTIVELMIAIALIGLIAGLSISSYLDYVEKARVASAVSEIAGIARILDGIAVDDDASLPDTLAEIGQDGHTDPWGNPYQYLLLAGNLPTGVTGTPGSLPAVAAPPGGGGGPPVIALARKDGFLVPINSDYDLYSMGKDGVTKPQLNHADSRDDVIRAADGSYIGLAERF